MKEKRKPGKKKALLFGAGGTALLLGGMAAGYLFVINREEEPVYREETVQYGTLTVGLQETGSVEVGTAEQTFELDMSAYTESGSGSFSWEQQGGNVFQGMTAGGSASSAERTLTVEEILVTEGQEVSEGDPLYRLAQDSIEEIREELAADVADAQVTLEQTQTQLAMTRLDAQQEYDTDTAYAEALAQAEYDTSLSQLQEAVTEIEEQITEANEELLELNEQLAEYQADLETEKKILENAEYVLETTDMITDAYGWITAENAREDAEAVTETLEEEIETAQDSITETTEEIAELTDSLTGAKQSLEQGQIDAQAQLSLRTLSYANASERYAVSVGMGEFFSGTVEEIGDAQYDSSTGTTYSDVTVKLSGDTAKLYDGMTAELTFVTKETETVTYVSNRAVYRENGKSYVRVYDENGDVASLEVVTGFSDGSNVEVIEGLEEGDTVLIESGVSGS